MAGESASQPAASLGRAGPDLWSLSGCLAIETARNALPAIEPVLEQAGGRVQRIDAAGLSDFDSAALAVMFEWERRARARGLRLAWEGLPQGLVSLARLYGVEAMLDSTDARG
ncbi:MAG: lipid asymmetry maintenance protein MlaB [Pseudomonadota bacterium]|jgi:phospholipid transport system transporter-binding protein